MMDDERLKGKQYFAEDNLDDLYIEEERKRDIKEMQEIIR